MTVLTLTRYFLAKGMIDSKNGKNTLDETAAQGYIMTFYAEKAG